MLQRNCCCCSLRGGALAVGIVFLSLSVAQLLIALIAWGEADAMRAYLHRQATATMSRGSFYNDNDRLSGVEILVPMTLLALVQLAFDALLVHGIRLSPTRPSTSRCCLVTWLIFRGVFIALFSLGDVALLIAAIITRYTAGMEPLSIALGGNFVMATVATGLFWYAWVVVLSFYWSLRSVEAGSIVYNRVQMETTAMGASRDAGRAEEFGGASAPQMAEGGQNGGQKWA